MFLEGMTIACRCPVEFVFRCAAALVGSGFADGGEQEGKEGSRAMGSMSESAHAKHRVKAQ